MFRCPITKQFSKPGEKPIHVVLEKRSRAYWDTDDGKAPKGLTRPEEGDRVYHVIGEGWETLKEAYVSRAGYEQLLAEGKLP